MLMQEQYVENARGHKLYVRVYQPAAELKGFIIFHHGYAQHTALFDHVYKLWTQLGLYVVAHDAQGYGRSKTDKVKLHALTVDMQQHVDDVIQLRKEIIDARQAQQPLPVFIGGHSMGGLIAALTAIRGGHSWQGLILVSPGLDAIRTFVTSILERLQIIALVLCPNARIVPAPPFEDCTELPELLHQFRTDPLMDQGPMRVRTGKAFLKGFADIAAGEASLTLPILLVASSTDKVISVPAIQRFLTNVKSTDITEAWIPGAMHEILLGTFQEQAVAPTVQWLQQHI